MTIEHKKLSLQQTEVKFGAEGGLVFEGYASVFNGVDSYGDTISPGAYEKTLKNRERPVALRWNHYGPVIGKYMEVYEDEKGLYVRGELTKGHSVAEDAAALLRHGAISGLSIGYIAKDYEETNFGRKLNEIELVEISLVEEPADNAARVDFIKSELENAKDLKGIEATLKRELGLSSQETTVIVSAVKNAIKQSDSECEKHTLDVLSTFKLSL